MIKLTNRLKGTICNFVHIDFRIIICFFLRYTNPSACKRVVKVIVEQMHNQALQMNSEECFAANLNKINKMIDMGFDFSFMTVQRSFYCLELNAYDECISECNTVIESDEMNKIAFFYRGYARLASGRQSDIKKAVADFSVAIDVEDLYLRVLFGRATCNIALQKYASAYSDLLKAVNTSQNAKYYIRLAHAAYNIGKKNVAEECLLKVLEKSGGHVRRFERILIKSPHKHLVTPLAWELVFASGYTHVDPIVLDKARNILSEAGIVPGDQYAPPDFSEAEYQK